MANSAVTNLSAMATHLAYHKLASEQKPHGALHPRGGRCGELERLPPNPRWARAATPPGSWRRCPLQPPLGHGYDQSYRRPRWPMAVQATADGIPAVTAVHSWSPRHAAPRVSVKQRSRIATVPVRWWYLPSPAAVQKPHKTTPLIYRGSPSIAGCTVRSDRAASRSMFGPFLVECLVVTVCSAHASAARTNNGRERMQVYDVLVHQSITTQLTWFPPSLLHSVCAATPSRQPHSDLFPCPINSPCCIHSSCKPNVCSLRSLRCSGIRLAARLPVSLLPALDTDLAESDNDEQAYVPCSAQDPAGHNSGNKVRDYFQENVSNVPLLATRIGLSLDHSLTFVTVAFLLAHSMKGHPVQLRNIRYDAYNAPKIGVGCRRRREVGKLLPNLGNKCAIEAKVREGWHRDRAEKSVAACTQ
eukprot:scaffold650_cov407-Prasinococcus_capsulatus_cf.AAC.50